MLRSQLPLIEAMPQVARGADGHAARVARAGRHHRAAARRPTTSRPTCRLRGVGPLAFEIRDTLKFVEGRRFTPGTREINVGKQAVGRFKGLTLGSDVKFGGATWKVVGVFTADDASFESEVWGDVDLMMPAFQRNGYQSVTVEADRSVGVRIVRRRRSPPIRASTSSRSASATTTRGSPRRPAR